MYSLKDKYISMTVRDDEVSELSKGVKDEAEECSTIRIRTRIGINWMSEELPILYKKYKKDNVKVKLIFKRITPDVIKMTEVFSPESVLEDPLTSLPSINITSKNIVLYHENEKKELREAILIENDELRNFFLKQYEKNFDEGFLITINKESYTSLRSIIQTLELESHKVLKSPDELRKLIEYSKPPFKILLAAYYIQEMEGKRMSTITEISNITGMSQKTVYYHINKFKKNPALKEYIKIHYTPWLKPVELTETCNVEIIPKITLHEILERELSKIRDSQVKLKRRGI